MVLIAVTGWGQESDREQSRDAGFDHHLVKPVDPAAVMKLVASLDQGASARGASIHSCSQRLGRTGPSIGHGQRSRIDSVVTRGDGS
ncbi:MAG TPA: hypothetical protein VKE40_09750 [Gemmataceae bacterium]|nr:hypothetical protein [Gemmataceae bacterium]